MIFWTWLSRTTILKVPQLEVTRLFMQKIQNGAYDLDIEQITHYLRVGSTFTIGKSQI